MKKLLCALALGACATSAQAALQTFDWSFQGFQNSSGVFHADKWAIGRFVVDDVNADGRFVASELRSFFFVGTEFMQCAPSPNRPCWISGFSYTPGRQLDVDVGVGHNSTNTASFIGFKSIDGQAGMFEHMRMDDWWSETQYMSTDQTRFSIVEVGAVPEPQTYLMFGAGMLALAGIARRRAQR
jgi:hypothetical protein